MDELKEKLTFLSVVTPQVLEGLMGEEGQAACEQLGPDLVEQLSKQIRLEELYVVAQTASDGTFTQADENEEQREDVKSLQKNTLELCRKMKAVPNIVQELRNFQDTRPGAVIQFLKTLADMQELTLKRLTTTVEEERSRAELFEYYESREHEASKRRQQLERDLTHIRRECERAQSQRSEILTILRAALLDVRVSKQEKMLALRTKYEDRMTKQVNEFNARKEELVKSINALRESNTKLKAASQEDEQGKKKTVKRYEMDVDAVIKTYTSNMKNMAYMLNEHQEGHKKEQKQLNELQEHFEKVEGEKECIMNEEGIANARRAKIEKEKLRRHDASCLVQAFWRGIISRDLFQAEKRKRKKKGGKKKK